MGSRVGMELDVGCKLMPAAPVSIAGPTEKSMRLDRCDGLWSIRKSQREIQLVNPKNRHYSFYY